MVPLLTPLETRLPLPRLSEGLRAATIAVADANWLTSRVRDLSGASLFENPVHSAFLAWEGYRNASRHNVESLSDLASIQKALELVAFTIAAARLSLEMQGDGGTFRVEPQSRLVGVRLKESSIFAATDRRPANGLLGPLSSPPADTL